MPRSKDINTLKYNCADNEEKEQTVDQLNSGTSNLGTYPPGYSTRRENTQPQYAVYTGSDVNTLTSKSRPNDVQYFVLNQQAVNDEILVPVSS